MANIDTRLLPRSRAAVKEAKPPPKMLPRPFRCFYYTDLDAKEDEYGRISACSSEVGAIRAAVVRLVIGQFFLCVVHDEDGVVRYRLSRDGGTIRIEGAFFNFDDWLKLVARKEKALERLRQRGALVAVVRK